MCLLSYLVKSYDLQRIHVVHCHPLLELSNMTNVFSPFSPIMLSKTTSLIPSPLQSVMFLRLLFEVDLFHVLLTYILQQCLSSDYLSHLGAPDYNISCFWPSYLVVALEHYWWCFISKYLTFFGPVHPCSYGFRCIFFKLSVRLCCQFF